MQELIINSDGVYKQIALVENGKLVERYEERPDMHRLEGNIYLGRVENVLQGMQAAFVNIGEEKNTFMHIKDVIPKVSNETGNKNELLSKYEYNCKKMGKRSIFQGIQPGLKGKQGI